MSHDRRRALPLIVAALTSTTLAAASPARASDWTVDPAKSTLDFSGTQLGQRFDGRFTRYDAAISFDPSHPEAARITVSIDLASAGTGDAQRDGALPGQDWFDVARFPRATFVSTTIRHKSGDAYEADGTLTLRGVAKPLTLPFTLSIDGTQALAKGHAVLLRDAFGVGQGAWSTGQWVALDVAVDIDITAKRAD